jgi:hypothetical protein
MLDVQIRVKGLIDEDWSEWFRGLSITHQPDDQTLLSGPVQDQAELYGLLARLWNLRLGLVSVNVAKVNADL